jgi:hypothetical protein
MSSSPESIPTPPGAPPNWSESSSFRETTLRLIDGEEERQVLRDFGRILYGLAIEAVRYTDPESAVRAELRTAAADLRYLQGHLAMVALSAEESELSVTDDALARFAGTLAADVANVAESIERELR